MHHTIIKARPSLSLSLPPRRIFTLSTLWWLLSHCCHCGVPVSLYSALHPLNPEEQLYSHVACQSTWWPGSRIIKIFSLMLQYRLFDTAINYERENNICANEVNGYSLRCLLFSFHIEYFDPITHKTDCGNWWITSSVFISDIQTKPEQQRTTCICINQLVHNFDVNKSQKSPIGCHKYVMWRVKDLLKRSVEDTLNNIYLLKEGRLLERLSEWFLINLTRLILHQQEFPFGLDLPHCPPLDCFWYIDFTKYMIKTSLTFYEKRNLLSWDFN